MTATAVDAALDLLAGLVLEDGRRWGEAAEDFQWEDARAVLDPTSQTPYSFLTRARGASKTSDLAGIAIVAMLAQLPSGSKLYGLAADRDQARLLIDSIEGFAVRTPELHGALSIQAYRVVATRQNTSLECLAADAASAWGLRPAFMVVDEIVQWPPTPSARRLWEAAATAIAKTQGRLVLLSTSGDPAHWSRKVYDHAVADDLWRVHDVPGPAPWMSPERLAEQKRRLPESSYRRLFENEWVSSEDRLASEDDIAACVQLDGPIPPQPGQRYICGLDVGLKNDRTVAAICHAERLRDEWGETVGVRVLLDRLQVWSGSRDRPVSLAEVEDWLGEAATNYRATIVFDPWQAIGLSQSLRRRGLRTEEFTFSASSVGRLASALLVTIRSHRLALPDDPELLDELRNVRVRETSPNVLRLDHDPDGHDDRAVALALAVLRLIERQPSSPDGASLNYDPSPMVVSSVGTFDTPGYDSIL